jgi:integrase
VASIERRPDGKWRTRWREHPGGPQRTRHFDRKVDAEQFLDGIRGDLVRGSYVDPMAGRILFGDYARIWQAAQVHRVTTVVQVESHLRRHILPFFGERPLASVRYSEVQAWVRDRSTVLAPATVEVVYRYVAATFKAAVEDRVIAASPCRGVRLPKKRRVEVVPLETAAVLDLVEAVPTRYRALVALAAGAGLRQGEAFGVTMPHVDFLRRTLRVEQQLILVPGREPFLAPPKTEASRRTVPLPQVVVEALARHLADFEVGPDGEMFLDDGGRRLRRNRFGESVWRPAVQRVGLPVGTGFHDLRHYYASLLIRHGESVKVVQSRLGHASATETLDTYAHLWPDSEDRTRQAVDSVLGASGDLLGDRGASVFSEASDLSSPIAGTPSLSTARPSPGTRSSSASGGSAERMQPPHTPPRTPSKACPITWLASNPPQGPGSESSPTRQAVVRHRGPHVGDGRERHGSLSDMTAAIEMRQPSWRPSATHVGGARPVAGHSTSPP